MKGVPLTQVVLALSRSTTGTIPLSELEDSVLAVV